MLYPKQEPFCSIEMTVMYFSHHEALQYYQHNWLRGHFEIKVYIRLQFGCSQFIYTLEPTTVTLQNSVDHELYYSFENLVL